ncbi:hypothetical protein [Natranaerobius trueperi]|uniref:hypothetical protein n=1 Tax=Natranaerobius trueperi TaxID=759412 RepID=UPI00130381CA|nr:hypothetical protein [Natranaerobius trueperi]
MEFFIMLIIIILIISVPAIIVYHILLIRLAELEKEIDFLREAITYSSDDS